MATTIHMESTTERKEELKKLFPRDPAIYRVVSERDVTICTEITTTFESSCPAPDQVVVDSTSNPYTIASQTDWDPATGKATKTNTTRTNGVWKCREIYKLPDGEPPSSDPS